MKKGLKIALLILLSIILFFVFCVGFYFINFQNATKDMKPLESGMINENIYAIKDSFANIYLIKSNNGYIAIDSGINEVNITNELKKLNIDSSLIHTLLLTHSDYDHIGGKSAFKNAKIYISEKEELLVTGKVARKFFMKNKIDLKYSIIKDEEILEIDGVKIKCLIVPGHTYGSASYLVNDKFLFTGDNLSIDKTGAIGLFPDFFNNNTKLQRESLEKLSKLEGVELILTGHHGITTNFDSLNNFKQK
ncbi:MAG TPA: MBL fold metallo-hydrolase [Spirochaetota bacterium]|nr:MBL fold metallo-hydrolase [Spirochaetota bacterium]